MSENKHQAEYEKAKHIAKNVNLVNFLQDNYPEIIVYNTGNRRYEHIDHDSLVINPTAFYWFSQNYGGDTIRFVQEFCEKDYNTAVQILCEYAGINGILVPTFHKKREQGQEIPEICPENKPYVFQYLTKERFLDENIIKNLMRTGDIYADKMRNAVFTSTEFATAFVRGTYRKGDKPNEFKKIIGRQGNDYILFMPTTDIRRVYITESPIDSISLYQLMTEEKREHSAFAAMLGLKREIVHRIEWEFPECELWIACDWDDKGNEWYQKNFKNTYKRMIAPKEYRNICKDWNGLLIERKKTER